VEASQRLDRDDGAGSDVDDRLISERDGFVFEDLAYVDSLGMNPDRRYDGDAHGPHPRL
jgi:hypothetical protein